MNSATKGLSAVSNYFAQMFSTKGTDDAEKTLNEGAIKVDKYTRYPNKAWEKRRRSQKCNILEPLDPNTPICEDKVRFVCISDTHTHLEKQRNLEIPAGDILVHTGDFTVYGTPDEVHLVNEYLGTLPHKHKVVIAGNHDMSFDLDFITHTRTTRIWSLTEDNYESRLKEYGVRNVHDMMTNCIYLQDSMIQIYGITIYGTPWQPGSGTWGFNRNRGLPLLKHWNKIPENTDVLLTHCPPCGHGDCCVPSKFMKIRLGRDLEHVGCVDLLNTIQHRVKPMYHIFGHIHEGYGVTTDGNTTFINASTCTENYEPINPPIVFDMPMPKGCSKSNMGADDVKWLIRNEIRSTDEQEDLNERNIDTDEDDTDNDADNYDDDDDVGEANNKTEVQEEDDGIVFE